MKFKLQLFFGLLLTATLLSQLAQAQTRQLTLNDAVNLAIEKNRDLQVSKLEINKSAEKLQEASRGYALPTVAASANTHFLKRQVTFLPGNLPGRRRANSYIARRNGCLRREYFRYSNPCFKATSSPASGPQSYTRAFLKKNRLRYKVPSLPP